MNDIENEVTDEQVETLDGTQYDLSLEPMEPVVEKEVYYGSDAISKVSENLGRPLTFAEQRVVEEEGYVATPYTDTKGITTQGVGQTGEWIEKGFEAAFQHHVERAKGRVPTFDSLPENLQAELVQSEYRGDLGGSPNFLRLLNAGEYDLAADEFLNNKDYRDSMESGSGVHKRMKRLSDAVRGQASGTEETTGEAEVAAPVKGDAVSGAAPLKSSRDVGNSELQSVVPAIEAPAAQAPVVQAPVAQAPVVQAPVSGAASEKTDKYIFGGDSELKLLDGDTYRDLKTGKTYRLPGIDTPETAKFSRTGGYKRGEAGGQEAMDAVRDLIEKDGFNIPVTTDDDAGYDRKKGDLMNSKGELLTDRMIATGLVTTKFIGKSDYGMSDSQYDRLQYNMLARNMSDPKVPRTDYEKATAVLREAETSASGGNVIAKGHAMNEAEYSALPELYSSVILRNKNANFDNSSKTPFSQSWNAGITQLKNSFSQIGSVITDSTGFEEARESLQGRIDYRKMSLSEAPKVIIDWKEVDGGNLESMYQYVTNNIAMSLPMMGVNVAGVLAAPFTYGGSLSVVVGMHSGSILDEMEGKLEDKDLSTALAGGIAMAGLDFFGLKGVLKPSSLINGGASAKFTQALMGLEGEPLKIAVRELGDRAGSAAIKGLTKEQAEFLVQKSSKRQLASYVKSIEGLIETQTGKATAIKHLAKSLAGGAAFEGSTEMAQELTQYTAVVMGSEKSWDYDELQERLVAAGIAGASMGSAFSVTGSAWDIGGWQDASSASADYDKRFDDASTPWKAEESAEYGKVRDLDEVMEAEHMDANSNTGRTRPRPSTASVSEEYDGMMNSEAVDMSFESQADRAQARKEAKGGLNWIGDFAKDPMSALRTSLDTRLTTDLLGKSKTARVIYDMFGGRKNQVHGGVDFHTDKVASYTLFEESITDVNATLARFNTKETGYGKLRTEVSAKIYDFHRDVIKPLTGRTKDNAEHMTGPEVIAAIDWDNLPQKYKADTKALRVTISELYDVDNVMFNNITARQSMAGEESLGKLQDHVFRAKSFLKDTISANKSEFINLLIKHKKLSPDDASAVTETILDNADASTLDDAFDLTKGGLNPAGYKKRSLDISDTKEFDKFLSNNVFDNLEAGMKGAARYMGSLKFIGKNNKLLGNMINKVHAELVANGDPKADEIVEDLAMNLRDLINADSGNYKRIESDMAKGIQKNVTLFGVITMLPLSAPMSLVEFALAPMNVPMKALNENIGSLGAILGKEIATYVENFGKVMGINSKLESAGFKKKNSVLDNAIESRKGRMGQDARQIGIENPKGLLDRVGMSGSQKTGQATLVGVSETDTNTTQIMDTFFKVIGLSGVTNATRTVRASFFNDFLISNMDKIHANEGKAATNESMEARQMLEEFGMPVDLMLNLSKKLKADPENTEVLAQWARQFDNGLYNFINGAVPMPSAMTRPLAYSDPHFALFMQFQGFTSQFTANHIPRIWKTIAKGTPGMKYSMFVGIMSMLMLGYAAQYIKDYIKFGGGSPYLSDDKKYLRALYSSGLLGTTERVIGNVFPLYDGRDQGIAMNMWGVGSGEAPAAGIFKNIYKAGEAAAMEEGTMFSKAALGLTPLSPLKHRITNYWTGE
jgi:endonuclease YncB( thermonuclease family)/GH24 family phage-related lysozyme (muramidase)